MNKILLKLLNKWFINKQESNSINLFKYIKCNKIDQIE